MKRRTKTALNDYKRGDIVIVNHFNHKEIRPVEDSTELYLIVGGKKYSKMTGVVVNTKSPFADYISVASEENVKQMEEEKEVQKLAKAIKNSNLERYSLYLLRRIVKILRMKVPE